MARKKKTKESNENAVAEPVTVAEPVEAPSTIEAEAEPVEAAPIVEETPVEVAEVVKTSRRKKKKGHSENPAEETPVIVEEPTVAESVAPTESTAEQAIPADETELALKLSAEELERTVEALLFAAEEPIAPREIVRASGSDSATIRKVLAEIKTRYETERRPWEVLEVASGYRLMTRAEFFPAIQRLKTQTAQRKMTQPALETLALIAYRQPIGRAEIETVRGVNAGPVLRQLLDKKLIKIAGRGTGLGQPLLYGTSDYFLENFGIKSMQELPKPGEFKNT